MPSGPGEPQLKAIQTHAEPTKEESEDELVSRFVTHDETEHEAYQRQHPEGEATQSESQFPPLIEVVDRKAIADRDATYHLVKVNSEEISVPSTVKEDSEMKKIVDEYYGMILIHSNYSEIFCFLP